LSKARQSLEIRTNELARAIQLLESRLTTLLSEKKTAAEANNLLAERHFELRIRRLETELLDVRDEYGKHKRWGAAAARELKAFNEGNDIVRLTELKALFESKDGVHPQAHKVTPDAKKAPMGRESNRQ
jgi:hypothetical protein